MTSLHAPCHAHTYPRIHTHVHTRVHIAHCTHASVNTVHVCSHIRPTRARAHTHPHTQSHTNAPSHTQVSENYLFHAYAWYKYYTLTETHNKALTAEERADMASNVLLAAMSIPKLNEGKAGPDKLFDADDIAR